MHFKKIKAHEMRLRLYRLQNGECWLCREPLDLFLPQWSYGSCSWEHVIPRSSGGSEGWKNVVITHWECNKLRGDRMIWSLRRPDHATWHSIRRSQLFPQKAQRHFAHAVYRLMKIFKKMGLESLRQGIPGNNSKI